MLEPTTVPDFDGVELDTTTVPQTRLNLDRKNRTNLFPWKGQFSPQLIETLLQTYAEKHSYVVDPFLGSGTVLHEAGRLGLRAFGSEVNPAAFKMASVYKFINVDRLLRLKVINTLTENLYRILPSGPSLFSPDIEVFIGSVPHALAGSIESEGDPLQKILLEALVVLLDYSDRELTAEVVMRVWSELRAVVISLPFAISSVELENCDARVLPLSDDRCDLVITSPPYINVFNYHQQYRKSVEAMGWDLLDVARSEIGSNRKHRSNRFLTVVQYCLDISEVLKELRRVSRPSARIILVVGRESNVRKTRFFNSEIVVQLATRTAGLHFSSRQERVFQNRFGELIREDILHLTRKPSPDAAASPNEIARAVLVAALDRVPEESRGDLTKAINGIDEVRCSPTYDRNTASSCQKDRQRKGTVER